MTCELGMIVWTNYCSRPSLVAFTICYAMIDGELEWWTEKCMKAWHIGTKRPNETYQVHPGTVSWKVHVNLTSSLNPTWCHDQMAPIQAAAIAPDPLGPSPPGDFLVALFSWAMTYRRSSVVELHQHRPQIAGASTQKDSQQHAQQRQGRDFLNRRKSAWNETAPSSNLWDMRETSMNRGKHEGRQRPRETNTKGDKREQRQGSGKKTVDPEPYHREVGTPYSLAAIRGKKTSVFAALFTEFRPRYQIQYPENNPSSRFSVSNFQWKRFQLLRRGSDRPPVTLSERFRQPLGWASEIS